MEVGHFAKKYFYTLLIITILLASVLRLYDLNWDESMHFHPVDKELSNIVNDISIPASLNAYFNTKISPLNPHNHAYKDYHYGTLPIFLAKFVGNLTGIIGYNGYTLVGRALSGFFDLLTILILTLIALKLFNREIALLTSFFISIAVIHIQHSHFFTVNLFACFFLALSFYILLFVLETQKIIYYILLGLAWGMALSCNLNSYLFFINLIFAIVWLFLNNYSTNFGRKTSRRVQKIIKEFIILFSKTIIIIISAFVAFRVFQPYAFAGPKFFNFQFSPAFTHMFESLPILTGSAISFPDSLQWYQKPIYYQIKLLSLWGFGIALAFSCLGGIICGLYRLFFNKNLKFALPLFWIFTILVFYSTRQVKTLSYLLPISPFLLMFAAYFIFEFNSDFYNRFHFFKKFERWLYQNRTGFHIITVFIIFISFCWTCSFINIYSGTISRIRASNWIYENIPLRSTIANEDGGDSLPLKIDGVLFKLYKIINLDLYSPDTRTKMLKLSADLEKSDYIFISNNKLYSAIPKNLKSYTYTANYYRLLFRNELGFTLTKVFTNYPTFFGIIINDDTSEQAFTIYDHPKVLIYKNNKSLSKEAIFKKITSSILDKKIKAPYSLD